MTTLRHAPLSRRARSLAVPLVAGLLTIPMLSGVPAQSTTTGVRAPAKASAASAATASLGAEPTPCRMKPTSRNTGATGQLRDKDRTVLGDGARLRNARVSSLEITGTDVKVENVHVDGNILVSGDKVSIKRVTAKHIGISSARNVVVARANIGYGAEDGIHVTSDGGRLVRRVVLRYNLIHHPRAPEGSHYDGTQVRGVDNMVIRCSTYRAGPYQETFNAGVFLENANGGVSNVTVERNWLYGSAWSVMVSANSARFIRNKLGGDIHWGYCYRSSGEIKSRGNVKVPGRRKINLCGQG